MYSKNLYYALLYGLAVGMTANRGGTPLKGTLHSPLRLAQSQAHCCTFSLEPLLLVLNCGPCTATGWGSSSVCFRGGGVGARGTMPLGERGMMTLSAASGTGEDVSPTPLTGLGNSTGRQGGLRSSRKGMVLLSLHPMVSSLQVFGLVSRRAPTVLQK